MPFIHLDAWWNVIEWVKSRLDDNVTIDEKCQSLLPVCMWQICPYDLTFRSHRSCILAMLQEDTIILEVLLVLFQLVYLFTWYFKQMWKILKNTMLLVWRVLGSVIHSCRHPHKQIIHTLQHLHVWIITLRVEHGFQKNPMVYSTFRST